MAENKATDVRTDNQKIKMAEWFESEEYLYREEGNYEMEIVYEDEDCVVVADHSGGCETDVWADKLEVERQELVRSFTELAEQKMGEEEAHDIFSTADPVVFDKIENKWDLRR